MATAVAGWLTARFGGDVEVAETPSRAGDGFDNYIHLTSFRGPALPGEWAAPLVLRVQPSPERAEQASQEAAIQRFCAGHGYPAPLVLAVLIPGEALDLPVQVMERVPGTTMLAVLERAPWRAGSLLAGLGRLHARLHALPVEGWPVPSRGGPGGDSLARRRLWLARRVVEDRPGLAGPGLAQALSRVERTLPGLETADPVVCHGDFHPLNVLVRGKEAHVIDWTDACLGDRHGDVARLLLLLREAAVGAPGAPARALLAAAGPALSRSYLSAYRRGAGVRLDRERLRLWEPVHLVHDWARAALAVEEDPGGARVRPQVLAWIRRRLGRAGVL